MTNYQKIKLQGWWMEQLREITRKTQDAEEKRQQRARGKASRELADFSIERREDIDELYAYGSISEKKRDKLLDLFDRIENPDEMFQAKIDLLQDAYRDAKEILRDLQEGPQ